MFVGKVRGEGMQISRGAGRRDPRVGSAEVDDPVAHPELTAWRGRVFFDGAEGVVTLGQTCIRGALDKAVGERARCDR